MMLREQILYLSITVQWIPCGYFCQRLRLLLKAALPSFHSMINRGFWKDQTSMPPFAINLPAKFPNVFKKTQKIIQIELCKNGMQAGTWGLKQIKPSYFGFPEAVAIEGVNKIDQIISDEPPMVGRSQDLWDSVRTFFIYSHSLYCRGGTLSNQLGFGYDRKRANTTTLIDGPCKRVFYRRMTHEGFTVVPYNAELTRRYQCHINVERAQGCRAVISLMMFDFKVPFAMAFAWW